jgi:hypothetical protein
MPRTLRVAPAVAVLLAVLVGTALAARHAPVAPGRAPLAASPGATPAEDPGTKHSETDADGSDSGGSLTEAAARALVERLAANGLSTDAATLRDLAATYGVGGAVRLIGWADASGRTVSELREIRDAGAGWGSIAHQLGLGPGIGRWMRNSATGDSSDGVAPPDGANGRPAASAGSTGRNHAPGLAKPH